MSARTARQAWHRAVPATAVAAGFLAVLVSYSGPLLIYLSAADAMSVSNGTFSSWVFAISIAAGLSSILLSLWLRLPIAMAWSAPGTVLLISGGASLSIPEMIGAYLAVAVALVLIGLSGLFERLVAVLPPVVTNGMMAGILFGFGLAAARGLASDPVTVMSLLAAFVVFSVALPRYAMLCLLVFAVVVTAMESNLPLARLGLSMASPEMAYPGFSLSAMLGLALPLLITTLSGQYLPGMAILRANGFVVSARPILIFGGIASAGAALFGGITTALASITAAFCAGPDSHADPAKRYLAGVACGLFFCLGGIFSGTIVDLLVVLPAEMIALLAGLALLGPIQKFLSDMVAGGDSHAGLLTFLFTTSGVSLYGIGAAFWGVAVGLAVFHLTRWLRKMRAGIERR